MRVLATIQRFAETGEGDVKELKGQSGELRCKSATIAFASPIRPTTRFEFMRSGTGARPTGEMLTIPASRKGEKEWGVVYHRRNARFLTRRVTMDTHHIDLALKESSLIAAVEERLPDFARACCNPDAPVIVMHQDAFAADYQEDEYKLLGMAIKFAGICGKEVQVIGTKRHTIDKPQTKH